MPFPPGNRAAAAALWANADQVNAQQANAQHARGDTSLAYVKHGFLFDLS